MTRITTNQLFNKLETKVLIDKKNLYNILISLKSSNLAIFCGQPGTWKKTLALEIARHLKGKSHFINIDSPFYEKNNILWFRDTIHLIYRWTDTLKFIIQASLDISTPYFLIINNFNYSRPELYLNPIINELDNLKKWKQSNKQTLFETMIKDKSEYEDLINFLREFFWENYFNFVSNNVIKNNILLPFDEIKWKRLQVYIQFTPNLKIIWLWDCDDAIGDILSENILSKSQFIWFLNKDNLFNINLDNLDINLSNREINILEKNPSTSIQEITNSNNLSKTKLLLEGLQPLLKQINNKTISIWTIEDIFTYIQNYLWQELKDINENNKNFIDALDFQISQKILSRINCDDLEKISKQNKNPLQNINNKIKNFRLSKKVIEYIENFC